MNGGLNVKDEGGNKWGPGRNGDLRDVWRRVVEGKKETAEKGRIVTVLGSEEAIDHDLSKLLYGLLREMSTIANNDQTRSPAAST